MNTTRLYWLRGKWFSAIRQQPITLTSVDWVLCHYMDVLRANEIMGLAISRDSTDYPVRHIFISNFLCHLFQIHLTTQNPLCKIADETHRDFTAHEDLTYWGLNKMTPIFYTIFRCILCDKIMLLWLNSHQNLFWRVLLTIRQQWFR